MECVELAVLVATYNGERYISDMFDSLLNQTYQDFRIYIHDDGSTDKTLSIIGEYKKKYPEKFSLLEYETQGSAKANFLSLVKHVDADYYMYADQDDVWLPKKMQYLIKKIKEKEKANRPRVVYSDMKVVDEQLNTISESFHEYIDRDPYRLDYRQIMIDNPAAGCSMCFNKALKEKIVLYRDLDKIEMHDVWSLVLASIFGDIEYISKPLVLYRQHSTNEMGAEPKESFWRKVKRNLFMKDFLKSKYAFHERINLLAEEILFTQVLPKDVNEILQGFINLKKCNKIQRMKYYKKYGFTRQKNDFWFRLWA